MGFYPVKLSLLLTVHVSFWLGRCLPCDPRSPMDLTGEADWQFVRLVARSKLLVHWIPNQNPRPNQPF